MSVIYSVGVVCCWITVLGICRGLTLHWGKLGRLVGKADVTVVSMSHHHHHHHHEREKRSLDMPDDLHLVLSVAGKETELRLRRSAKDKPEVTLFPLFLLEGGTVKRRTILPLQSAAVYSNDTQGHTMIVRRQDRVVFILEGVFNDAVNQYHVVADRHGVHWVHTQEKVVDLGGDYIDKPGGQVTTTTIGSRPKRNAVDRRKRNVDNPPKRRPRPRPKRKLDSAGMSPSPVDTLKRRRRAAAAINKQFFQKLSENRKKRQTEAVYEIEILMVADFKDYSRWLTYYGGNKTKTEEKIHLYYALIANSISQRYHNIRAVDPFLRIDIIVSGLLIVSSRDDSYWTENHVMNPGSDYVEATLALESFKNWRHSLRLDLPSSDHWMLFTGFDIYTDKNTNIAGLTKLGALCTHQSVSIIEQDNTGSVGAIAAHELGHSLSARHDGEVSDCTDDDNFIMSRKLKTPDAEKLASRPWQFSRCSVLAFREFLSRVRCGQRDSGQVSSLPTTELGGGQVFSADKQCQLAFGPDSYLGRIIHSQYTSFPSMCQRLYCALPGKEKSDFEAIFAMEKTSCGDGKWCIQGICTEDRAAPRVRESCPQGDDPSSPCTISDCRFYTPITKNVLCCKTCESGLIVSLAANVAAQKEIVQKSVTDLPSFEIGTTIAHQQSSTVQPQATIESNHSPFFEITVSTLINSTEKGPTSSVAQRTYSEKTTVIATSHYKMATTPSFSSTSETNIVTTSVPQDANPSSDVRSGTLTTISRNDITMQQNVAVSSTLSLLPSQLHMTTVPQPVLNSVLASQVLGNNSIDGINSAGNFKSTTIQPLPLRTNGPGIMEPRHGNVIQVADVKKQTALSAHSQARPINSNLVQATSTNLQLSATEASLVSPPQDAIITGFQNGAAQKMSMENHQEIMNVGNIEGVYASKPNEDNLTTTQTYQNVSTFHEGTLYSILSNNVTDAILLQVTVTPMFSRNTTIVMNVYKENKSESTRNIAPKSSKVQDPSQFNEANEEPISDRLKIINTTAKSLHDTITKLLLINSSQATTPMTHYQNPVEEQPSNFSSTISTTGNTTSATSLTKEEIGKFMSTNYSISQTVVNKTGSFLSAPIDDFIFTANESLFENVTEMSHISTMPSSIRIADSDVNHLVTLERNQNYWSSSIGFYSRLARQKNSGSFNSLLIARDVTEPSIVTAFERIFNHSNFTNGSEIESSTNGIYRALDLNKTLIDISNTSKTNQGLHAWRTSILSLLPPSYFQRLTHKPNASVGDEGGKFMSMMTHQKDQKLKNDIGILQSTASSTLGPYIHLDRPITSYSAPVSTPQPNSGNIPATSPLPSEVPRQECYLLCSILQETTLNSDDSLLLGRSRFFRSRMETMFDRVRQVNFLQYTPTTNNLGRQVDFLLPGTLSSNNPLWKWRHGLQLGF